MKKKLVVFENAFIEINETKTLENLSFEIFEDDFIYLIGKTGSGKSSILRTIYSDIKLKTGNCTVLELMDDRVYEVLEKVGMRECLNRMPHQLSGGEQQRIAIARALLNKPKLILADEPTGNLDPQTSTEIMNLLNDIHKEGSAIFMATHDYNTINKYPKPTLRIENNRLFQLKSKSII